MNTGSHKGKETLLWYIVDPEARITQPIRKLKQFEKIELEPGEAQIVSYQIQPEEHLSYLDSRGIMHLESGDFHIEVGGLKASFTLE